MSERRSIPKRRQTEKGIGAPSIDDNPTRQLQLNDPSSSASSSRLPPCLQVPTLSSICIRLFASSFLKLHRNEGTWKIISEQLKLLPDHLIPRVFASLRVSCPTYLPHEIITTYFCRGTSFAMSKDLTGVKSATVTNIARFGANLRELKLTGFDKYPDTTFASVVSKLTQLQVLVLRGCVKVGASTVEATAKHCPNLRTLNLNYTSASPAALGLVLVSCTNLEVLKLAGIASWKPISLSKLIEALPEELTLPNMHSLKLRQTAIGNEAALFNLLGRCPNLKRLDLSHTTIAHSPSSGLSRPSPPLEKLSLTSTQLSGQDILDIVSLLPRLKVLSLGAMGGVNGRLSMGNSSAMTLSDSVLRSLADILMDNNQLENVNLVGNIKLGTTKKDSALQDFVARIGRRCKWLNISAVPTLKSFELSGLLALDGADTSRLETLILNNTSIDDDAATFIASCAELKRLEVAGTKMTDAGLFQILDGCEQLTELDLTSCRGVSVGDRRRFFEVWQERNNNR